MRYLGMFQATHPRIWTGNVLYQFVVAPDQILALRIGGQFSGAGGDAVFRSLGLLGVLIAKYARGKQQQTEQALLEAIEHCEPDELLARDRANLRFAVDDITRASLLAARWFDPMMWGRTAARLQLYSAQLRRPMQLLLEDDAELAACHAALAVPLADRFDSALQPQIAV